MPKYSVKNGQTSNVFRVFIQNSSVTTGAGLTGLTSASSGLIISTIADNEASATTYTVAGSTIETITTLGTFAAPTATKCRFKEVDSTNHPGIYELQIADARFAVSSAKKLYVTIVGATNAAQCNCEIELTAVDQNDAVRGGMTALPNAAAEASGGLFTRGTGAGQINQDANGRIDANAKAWNGTAVATPATAGYPVVTLKVGTGTGEVNLSSGKAPATIAAGDLATDSITAAALKTDAVTEIQSGLASQSSVDTANAALAHSTYGLSALQVLLAALQTSVNNIANNTSTRLVVAPIMELPESSTTVFELDLLIMDENGNMEAPDSTPTVTAKNSAGTDRSAGLSALIPVSTGHYSLTYTLNSTDTVEQLVFTALITEGAQARKAIASSSVVNADITGTAAKVNSIYADYARRTGDYSTYSGGAVASVTGNVGGNVTGSIGSLATQAKADVNAEVDTALGDYDAPTKAEMDAAFVSVSGATFDTATDSLEAIRNRGDAAWITGGAGSAPTVEEIRIEMDDNSTQLAAIKAKTDTIGSGTVTVVSPVATDGTLTLTVGDDYYNADGRAIPFTLDGAPSITGGSCSLNVGGKFTATGTIVSSTVCRFDVTRAQTALLIGLTSTKYELKIVLSDGHHLRPIIGYATITEGKTTS